MTFLPDEERFRQRLRAHLKQVRRLYETHPDVPVSMPPALARKYPAADTSWEWQYLFPSHDLSVDPRTLVVKRHHLHPSGIQRAITAAVRAAGIPKRVTAYTLRAAFAHRLKIENLPRVKYFLVVTLESSDLWCNSWRR